ncbi:MAG: hypothetical protein RB296_04200 [Acidobacteriota bacterium]|jgi:hypothetical protein|nr:hypothetical protein [Acidobacteriota bacterium]
MKKSLLWILACGFVLLRPLPGQDDYLKITASITPEVIRQGEEGVLTLKIQPRENLRISSAPEFVIKLAENANLTFSKYFFTASELDFDTEQEGNLVYLALDKEITIPFKVNGNSLIGKQQILGEVQFTTVFEDHWSLKTFQKFSTAFRSLRGRNPMPDR